MTIFNIIILVGGTLIIIGIYYTFFWSNNKVGKDKTKKNNYKITNDSTLLKIKGVSYKKNETKTTENKVNIIPKIVEQEVSKEEDKELSIEEKEINIFDEFLSENKEINVDDLDIRNVDNDEAMNIIFNNEEEEKEIKVVQDDINNDIDINNNTELFDMENDVDFNDLDDL